MIELARVQPKELAADLGSGDGRILIALAKSGAIAHGYEIDIRLIMESERIIKENDLQHLISIHNKNFWEEDLSDYDIITVYPMPDVMKILEEKLLEELMPGARVLLNYYPFKTWQPETVKDNIYLYIKEDE